MSIIEVHLVTERLQGLVSDLERQVKAQLPKQDRPKVYFLADNGYSQMSDAATYRYHRPTFRAYEESVAEFISEAIASQSSVMLIPLDEVIESILERKSQDGSIRPMPSSEWGPDEDATIKKVRIIYEKAA